MSSRSKPSRVPSASMELSRISPAPSSAARAHHSTASTPVRLRPPWVVTSNPPDGRPEASRRRRTSAERTRTWAPNRSAISAMSSGRAIAAVLTPTLSAPARSSRSTSSTVRTPPPTVSGMNTSSAVRATTSYIVARSPLLAVTSRKVSSSAPCVAVAAGELHRVTRVPEVLEVDTLDDPSGVDVETGDDADRHGQHATERSGSGEEELRALFGRLGADPRGGTCVEVGCGPGRMTGALAQPLRPRGRRRRLARDARAGAQKRAERQRRVPGGPGRPARRASRTGRRTCSSATSSSSTCRSAASSRRTSASSRACCRRTGEAFVQLPVLERGLRARGVAGAAIGGRAADIVSRPDERCSLSRFPRHAGRARERPRRAPG